MKPLMKQIEELIADYNYTCLSITTQDDCATAILQPTEYKGNGFTIISYCYGGREAEGIYEKTSTVIISGSSLQDLKRLIKTNRIHDMD